MNPNPDALTDYRSHRDLPPIAGITTFADAMRVGFSIDDCVARLKRLHWAFRRLHGILVQRLTAEPVYELKMTFSLHSHYCAEHAAALRARVAEMREPPLGLDVCPHPALDVFFDEILAAPSTEALLLGLYEQALPALLAAIDGHLRDTNKLVDHPSYRLCRFARIEVEEMCATGRECVERLAIAETRDSLSAQACVLERLLARAGGLDGATPVKPDSNAAALPRLHTEAGRPPAHDKVPRRDERFPDPYNMGVHAEAFLYDETMPIPAKPLLMYYKRLREIDVPEMMASILAESPDKSWNFTREMTRQLWDEARHAMMGEVGFVRAGIDWRKYVRINFTWSLALNTQLGPRERHAVLYFIEQGLMPRTGKRFEWELGVDSGDAFAAMIQDYDWADEVLHARIGRDHYVKDFGTSHEAIAYGDECWNQVLIDWESYRAKGLTQHENWWPALYREFCRQRGLEPDPRALAFDINYSSARADLKEISTSG